MVEVMGMSSSGSAAAVKHAAAALVPGGCVAQAEAAIAAAGFGTGG
jgi:hypothetical protein